LFYRRIWDIDNLFNRTTDQPDSVPHRHTDGFGLLFYIIAETYLFYR